MTGNSVQNWPVYLLLLGFIAFIIFAILNGRQQEKKDKEAQNKDKEAKL